MAPESLIGHPGLKSRNLKHFVHFYNNDSGLADEVAGFVSSSLEQGDSAIVIATETHRAAFEMQLKAPGI